MRRYDLVDITLCGEQWREMIEDSLGEWVLFDDVEASVMTSDRYLAEIQEHRRLYGRAEADRDAAVARAERAEEQRDRARVFILDRSDALRLDGGLAFDAALADEPEAQP